MSSELALITQLLNRIGKEGDAASAAGSVHGKIEALFSRIGTEGDAASAAGSVHGKLEQVLADLAASGGGATDYLDGVVSVLHPAIGTAGPTVTPGSAAFGSWAELAAGGAITVDFALVGFSFVASSLQGTRDYYVEIGTGAAGSEAVVARSAFAVVSTPANVYSFIPLPKPVRISANSRVAMRAGTQASSVSGSMIQTAILYYPLA